MVISGVLQGTVFFILIINDMKLCVTDLIIRLFADDTRILKHIYTEQDVTVLQRDLDHVIAWAKRNNMVIGYTRGFELLLHQGNPNESL